MKTYVIRETGKLFLFAFFPFLNEQALLFFEVYG